MKRWILYALVLAILGIAPTGGMDIGRLSPVQTVWLTEINGQIYMQTDVGEFGVGSNIEEALRDLNKAASSVVFLETADYLIIEKGREELLEQAAGAFRPSCMLCTAKKMPDLEKATDYLRIHEPGITLRQWRAEESPLQELREQEGRFGWNDG